MIHEFRIGALAGLAAPILLLAACGEEKMSGPEPKVSPHVPDVAPPVPAATAAPDVARQDLAFEGADTNGDGLVSSAEYAASANRMFRSMDADRNGTLTVAELDSARDAMQIVGGPSSEKLIQRADNDRDNKLTLAEFIADVNARFALADRNKDGSLTPAEFYSGHPEVPQPAASNVAEGATGAPPPVGPAGTPPR